MAWDFRWLRSWDEIWEPGHLAGWRAACEAADAAATPFMHPALVRAWLATVGGADGFAPFFLEATDGERRILWLLVRPRAARGGIRRLSPVGDGTGGPHFAYNDPVLAPGTAGLGDFWPAFEREMRGRAGSWFDSFALHRLRSDMFGGTIGSPAPQGSPFVRLDTYADFGAYMAARPNGLLKRIERKRRKLLSEASVEVRAHGPGEAAEATAWLPDLEAAQLARYPESAVAPGLLAHLVAEGIGGGLVRPSVLRVDGRGASWRIDYLLGDTLYLGFCAIDMEFHRHSPGHLHSMAVLEAHVAQGGRVYDLLIGEQAYKYDWTDGAEHRLRRLGMESRAPSTLLRRQAGRVGRALGLGR